MTDMHAFLFWVIGGLTGACAIATVVTHNIVRAATWLLFTLGGTAALFFLIGADLVGAIQLLVYVGGTLVLVIFGVMLTAQGPFISLRTSSAEWAVSAGTGIALFAVMLLAVIPGIKLGPAAERPENEPVKKYAPRQSQDEKPETSNYTMAIGQGFLSVGVGPAHRDPNSRVMSREVSPRDPDADPDAPEQTREVATAPGTGIVRTHYLLPFEIISVHLLVVLIGAAYLARTKRRREETP